MRRSNFMAVAAILAFSATVQAAEFRGMTAAYRGGGGSMRGGSCGCAEPGCDSMCQTSCDTCQPCCPQLLPMVVGKLDCLLQNLFFDPCNVPCCRPMPMSMRCCSDAWVDYAPSCGCHSGSGTNWSPTPTPSPKASNPFVEDELQMPPQVPKDARLHRKPATRIRSITPKHESYSVNSKKVAPVVISDVSSIADESDEAKSVVKVRTESKPLRQVKHESVEGRAIPKNPLRSE